MELILGLLLMFQLLMVLEIGDGVQLLVLEQEH
jgi:hypothetical protein